MYPRFDVSKIRLKPLSERQHDTLVKDMRELGCTNPLESTDLDELATRIIEARRRGSAVIAMMGAHVIKVGMSRFIIDLLERGFITHLGLNGACVIHDFELSLVGGTSESVQRYISAGQFGLWQETGHINDIVKDGASRGYGIGEAVGKAIYEGEFPHRDISILAAGYRLKVPVTVHVSIGQDIIHGHPNFDGSSWGRASHTDFLIFAESVRNLEGGVFLNIGTAVMGPEVYLKALSMARNVAHHEGKRIANFTTAVLDMQPIQSRDYHSEPSKDQPEYYHRFWKTILVRTVRDGGTSYYIQGDHRNTIASLWDRLVKNG
ncbi:MAG TPA: hypothetical protein GX008_01795 [Firmicutes bacterium]|jgi:hypothetical protein|nr:hypothetical protein [Bacillota bacterium]